MEPSNPFQILAVIAVLATVFFSVLIVFELHKRHVKINWFLLKLYLPRYMEQYRKMTKRETGQTGPFYRAWLFSMILVWVFILCVFIF